MLATTNFDLADTLLLISAIDTLYVNQPLNDEQKARLRSIVSRITDQFPEIKYDEPIQLILARLETKSA